MTQAIWALLYAVEDSDRERYLDWFHAQHIPDKLSRPGYTWAAHYEHAMDDDAGRRGYLAFFGGESSRVFFDPSPAQLKARQDALTREMIGARVQGRSVVYCEEWGGADTAVDAPALALRCIDAAGEDEALQSWCVQQLAPAALAAPGVRGMRKWLAASTAPRHALVLEFDGMDATLRGGDLPAMLEGVTEPFGPARVAMRVWPR